MSETINDLRAHLFDAIKGVKDNSMSLEKAKAISDISQVIVNTAKVEVQFAQVTGGKKSGFLAPDGALPVIVEPEKGSDPVFPEKVSGFPEHPGFVGTRQHRLEG